MVPEDAAGVSRLIRETFLGFVAHTYRPRGVRWFLRHNTPGGLRARLRKGQLVLVGEAQGRLAGVVAVRSGSHVSLLFVRRELHGQGIGRELLESALAVMQQGQAGLECVTVNSSDHAIPFYRAVGFEPLGRSSYRKGMKITPMRKSLESRESEG